MKNCGILALALLCLLAFALLSVDARARLPRHHPDRNDDDDGDESKRNGTHINPLCKNPQNKTETEFWRWPRFWPRPRFWPWSGFWPKQRNDTETTEPPVPFRC